MLKASAGRWKTVDQSDATSIFAIRDTKRAETESIIAILEDKRSEVMSRTEAGYFIRDWQEISDQVRQMIFQDPRYQAIKNNRAVPTTLIGD